MTQTPASPDALRLHLAYLQAVVASMAQGISVFDQHLRLRVWNARFIEVLDLPPEIVVEGVEFADLIRIPAERGEYGPGNPEDYIRDICALARQFLPHRFERARPAGRTHLVQGEPLLLDGQLAGFITTYTDISEQKAATAALQAQHELLETVIESVPCGITMFDKDFRLQLANSRFRQLLDVPDEFFTSPAPSLGDFYQLNAQRGEYGPGEPELIVSRLLARAQQHQAHHFERTRPNGQTLDVRGRPMADGGLVTIYTDISDRVASAEKEKLAQVVFEHTPAGIFVTDERLAILSSNPSASRMTGLTPEQIIACPAFDFIDRSTSWQQHELHTALSLHHSWRGEIRLRRADGETFPASLRIKQVEDQLNGVPQRYIWIFADITERKEHEARMQHIAQHDPLTGLPNRLALLTRLSHLLPEARRHDWRVGVMFIDLDRFKTINDTLGHQVGDLLLREVATRLSAVIRETDFVARLGGDEFVIILPGISSPADAALVASKVINSLAPPIQADGNELHTSPSIGISLFPDDGSDSHDILKNADTAMYHAKSAGRNNYQFFAPNMNQVALERMNIERKLRRAVSNQEFALQFQPQFDTASAMPTGVEALLRWHHPVDGVIAPDRFIPIAEETGLIVEIGDWVLHTACREVKRWIDQGLAPLRIAINVSARQLRRRDFCEIVAGVLAESGLPPELLELEITESSVMENPEDATLILARLGRMGINLAIDDFGTGYSSLAYLKLFPIDRLKIDRSFVRDIEYDLNDRAIAFGTIALAHSLGLKVIAEGVETDDQLELLRSNDCDEVQGFLFSKPLDGPAAFAFLHARQQGG
ncbi:EAL domain-containing protein [Azonexus sp.]|uniref:EAL domain-containing protein n=1 Tax=Azonexus sp. TaxID=1872668 RepID=UPI0039E251C8